MCETKQVEPWKPKGVNNTVKSPLLIVTKRFYCVPKVINPVTNPYTIILFLHSILMLYKRSTWYGWYFLMVVLKPPDTQVSTVSFFSVQGNPVHFKSLTDHGQHHIVTSQVTKTHIHIHSENQIARHAHQDACSHHLCAPVALSRTAFLCSPWPISSTTLNR